MPARKPAQALRTPLAVTVSEAGLEPAERHAPAADDDDQVLGRADVDPEVLAVAPGERLQAALVERPGEEELPAGPAAVHGDVGAAADRLDLEVRLRLRAARGAEGRRAGLAGGGLPPPEPEVCQALMTTTVTIATSATTTRTMLVSRRRVRRSGRTLERRGRASQSSPTTKRELYSST